MDFNWDELQRNYKPMNPKVPQKKQVKKNFLQDQISTGGGMAGAGAGALAGAGLGSIVPGVGTVIGGLAGAIIGGAGGGAAGQYIENGVVGEENMGKGVLREGALNGAFALGPVRGLAIAGHGAKALAGRTGLREGIEQGATATPIRSAIGNKLGGKLSTAGQNLLGSQANLTRAQTRKLGPGGAPADVLGGINKTTGLSSIDDMAEVGANVTGSNGALSELTRNAIGNSKGVDVSDLRTVANDLLVDMAPLATPAQRKNVLEQVQNSVVKVYGGSKGSLDTLANPLDTFDVARSFEKMAAKIRTSPTVSPADEQLAGVYSSLAKNMTERLYGAPGVTEGVQLAKGEAVSKFTQLAEQATNKQQKEAYYKLANQAQNMGDVKAIRTAQAPFVKLSKIDEETRMAQAGAAAQFGDQMTGIGRYVQKPLNMLAAPLNAGTPRAGGALARLGNRASGMGGSPVNPVATAPMAGRMALGGALTNTGTLPQAPEQDMASLEQALMSQEPQPNDPMMEQPSNPFGVSQEQVAQQMMIALQNGDSKGFDDLKAIYDMIGETQSAGGGNMNSSTAKSMAQAANGENTISQLEALLGDAGGGSGRVGGRISGIMGDWGMNDDAKTYNDLASGSTAQIAKALGETGALSDSDIKTYGNMLPRLTDTPEVAKRKIAALRQRLAVAQQNTALYGGGATDLEQALY